MITLGKEAAAPAGINEVIEPSISKSPILIPSTRAWKLGAGTRWKFVLRGIQAIPYLQQSI